MRNKPPLFFDTVVLSNFAFVSNGISFLLKRYGKRGHITLQVMEELAKTAYSGFNHFEEIESAGFIKTSLVNSEHATYLALIRNLGTGEASCIAAAEQRGGIVVTDDRLARNICKERKIPLTGTIGILKAANQDSIIDLDEADSMLKKMIECGFYSPVQKISDTL
jgi:predicted nucleic acid-binding protein